MPTVKWVAIANMTDCEVQYSNGTPMVPQAPVLTLDDLEAWLKEELRATKRGIESRGIHYLLLQVQAMKEGQT